MVGLTAALARIPVIKFRKGGLGRPAGATPSTAASAPSVAPAAVQATSAPMSTSTISDIDLPPRYRRAPLSEEEIAHINGGGIV